MEHGPLKRYWSRWPGIMGLLGIGVLGCFMIKWGFFPETVLANQLGTEWFFWLIGGFFALFGTGFAINHFLTGAAYYRHSKVFPEDTDMFKTTSNGLLVILKGYAQVFTYRSDKLAERGYVNMKTIYNRKKKVTTWLFTID